MTLPLCAIFRAYRQTIRKKSLILNSKNVSGRDFLFPCLADIERVVCDHIYNVHYYYYYYYYIATVTDV